MPATIGVTIVPGHTALQRIPVPANLNAVCFVVPITAALEATYAAPPQPITPATEATLTIEPLPVFAIWAAAARMQYIVPLVLISIILLISSSVARSIGFNPSSRTPAQLISTSTFPYASTAFAIRLSASSALEISETTGRTSPPASRIFAATSSS